MFLLSGKHRIGWLVSLVSQTVWFAFMVVTAAWGLFPINVLMTILAIRGWFKWKT